MTTMRAVEVRQTNGPLELVERKIPEPAAGQVRIRVEACGVCHGDSVLVEGHFPRIAYPRVPGHEIAGVVDAVGPGAGWLEPGERVAVGWHGGHCGHCDACRRGDFLTCASGQVTGISLDGGYADYTIVPAEAVARIPEGLSAVEAAPLMCAGLTTFNALRNSGARPGDLVAVLGVGGLGHLGVQYAAKMGFHTVAIARGADKGPLARELGAAQYVDSLTEDPAAELRRLGGARVILSTVTSGPPMAAAVGGLGIDGTLLVVGASGPFEVSPLALIGGRRSIVGWASGRPADAEDTLRFSVRAGVRSTNELMPLERAAEGYDRMMRGDARFRVVLTT
jgi:D-arabinose 1-dehydrogenase-like Zn-dependent alcohol dehydrogenase